MARIPWEIRRTQRGTSLIEALIALPLLLLAISGLIEIIARYATWLFISHLAHETLICVQEKKHTLPCVSPMKQRIQKQLPWVHTKNLRAEFFNEKYILFISYKLGAKTYHENFQLEIRGTPQPPGSPSF